MQNLEEKKNKLDRYIGQKLTFPITNSDTHQFELVELTLKKNEINTYLDMVVSFFEEASDNFFINGEVLYKKIDDTLYIYILE